jgi:hypothetical protein
VCATPSGRIHSRYTRTVTDLPWATSEITLSLYVRKVFYDVPTCSRRIFTERLPTILPPLARCTLRSSQDAATALP